MAKLNLTASGNRKKVVTERDMEVTLGSCFRLKFAGHYFYVGSACCGLYPTGIEYDCGNANAEHIRHVLMDAIVQVETFDKDAALAELKQALEQVDEIVELVK
jgi:hypothetical protein